MSMNVIIADDSATARMFTKRCLEVVGLTGAQVREADNGRKVLDYLNEDKADLIVLDINMPEMDGTEVLSNLQTHNDFSSIPVIVVSSVSNDEMNKKLFDSGASAVIKKPVSPAKFVEPIKKLNLQEDEGDDGW